MKGPWGSLTRNVRAINKAGYTSLIALVVLFVAVFYKPLLLGKCISRIGSSALLDGAFRSDTLPAPLYPDFDPSVYYWYMPVRDFFFGKLLHANLPFWDQYRAFGYSEFSHPSQSLLNPAFLISPVGHEYLYCAVTVLQTLVGAVGTWFVCRRIGLGQWSCFWAAIAYGLSCRIIAGLELVLFDCFVPWLFLSVLWLVTPLEVPGQTLKMRFRIFPPGHPVPRLIAIAFIWAYGFMSMHIEVFVVSLGAILTGFVAASPFCRSLSKTTGLANAIHTLTFIIIAGVLSMAIVAPFLVPMLEHLRNSDFYKNGMACDFSARFCDLLRDSFGWKGFDTTPTLSLFCGPFTPLLFLCAFCLHTVIVPYRQSKIRSLRQMAQSAIPYGNAHGEQGFSCDYQPAGVFAAPDNGFETIDLSQPLRILGILALICVGWAYPNAWLVEILKHPPLSWLAPQYFLPAGILSVAVISACGLELLMSIQGRKEKTMATIVIVSGLAVVGAVFALSGAAAGYTRSSVWLPAAGIALLIAYIWTPRTFRSVVLLALIAINTVVLMELPRKLVRTRPPIKSALRLPPTLAPLCGTNDRIAVCGINYLIPNIGTLFRINQIEIADPLLPRGYQDFLELVGAKRLDGFHLNFSRFPKKAIMLTGVRFLASRGAIVPDDVMERCARTGGSQPVPNTGVTPGLRVVGGWIQVDQKNQQVFGRLNVRIHPLLRSYSSPRFKVAIVDQGGNLVDSGDVEWTGELPEKLPSEISLDFALILPEKCASPKLALKVENQWTGTAISSGSLEHKLQDEWTVVSESLRVSAQVGSSGNSQGSLRGAPELQSWVNLKDDSAGGHRLYEVHNPLPLVSFIDRVQFGGIDTLRNCLERDIAPETLLVLDEPAPMNQGGGCTARGVRASSHLQWEITSNAEFIVKVDAVTPGYVVLRESLFPGWTATVDGAPVQIHKANILFQAVAVPAGIHLIRFAFFPPGLALGLAIFSLSSLIVLGIILWYTRRRGNHVKTSVLPQEQENLLK